ncbi:hypothetical protein TNCV_954571 [Trichonephila clavipes]|nr:hypothetical protein TNCV_954571 [Trichonephila clavipes]
MAPLKTKHWLSGAVAHSIASPHLPRVFLIGVRQVNGVRNSAEDFVVRIEEAIGEVRVTLGIFSNVRSSMRRRCKLNSIPKDTFSLRQSASRVERLANQRLYLGQDEVSDWLDAQRSTLTALV